MMKSIVSKMKNFLPLFVLFVLTVFSCNRQSSWLEIRVGGKEYSYRRIEHKVKDLEKEPVNTRWIQTRHLVIQYNSDFDEYLGNIVRVSEEAHEKVSKDLKIKMTGRTPEIFYLKRNQFDDLAKIIDSQTSPCSGFYIYGEKIIAIDGEKDKLDNGHAEETMGIVTHEITHLFFDQIKVGVGWKDLAKLRACHGSLRFFDEGLAEYERIGGDNLEEALVREFPKGKFLTLNQMDSVGVENSSIKSTTEPRALIKFLKEKWGENTFLDILHSLNKFTIQEAIAKYTKMPFDQFQSEWFEYMKDLISKAKGGNDYGKDTTQSKLSSYQNRTR